MLKMFYRTIVMYLVVLFSVRVMGKREVGQLSPFDLVVAIMIAELAAMAMEQIEVPIYVGLTPIITLVLLEMVLAWLSLKSHTIRALVDGAPSIVISNGKIVEKEMRKLRYNVSDLLGQLREKNVHNIDDVQFAVLETSGELSVVLKDDRRPLTPKDLGLPPKYEGLPFPLIFDGKIHRDNLRKLYLDENWLLSEVQKKGIASIEDVLYASLDCRGVLYVSEKEKNKPGSK